MRISKGGSEENEWAAYSLRVAVSLHASNRRPGNGMIRRDLRLGPSSRKDSRIRRIQASLKTHLSTSNVSPYISKRRSTRGRKINAQVYDAHVNNARPDDTRLPSVSTVRSTGATRAVESNLKQKLGGEQKESMCVPSMRFLFRTGGNAFSLIRWTFFFARSPKTRRQCRE